MKVDRDILNNLCLNITDGEHGTIQNDNDGRYFLLSNKNIINGQIIISDADRRINKEWYMAAFFRQVKIGVLTLTLEKKQ